MPTSSFKMQLSGTPDDIATKLIIRILIEAVGMSFGDVDTFRIELKRSAIEAITAGDYSDKAGETKFRAEVLNAINKMLDFEPADDT